jgi:hypothetical protein
LVCESFNAPGTAQEAQSNIGKFQKHRYNRIRLHHFKVVLAPEPFAALKPLLTLKVGRCGSTAKKAVASPASCKA